MLSAVLQDAAVAAAKGQSHAEVEPRHVLYAAARHLRARPEIEPLVPIARAALEPRGASIAVPAVTPEARALLDSLTSEQATVDLLLAKLRPAPGPGAEQPVPAPSPTPPPQAAPAAKPAAGTSTARPGETTAAVLAELDALVGLDSVKQQVKRIIAVVQANEERQRAGLAPVSASLHLVFTGPPGTGKTTVARLIARLYASVGALPGANFVEATRADLVAGYVGQTAIKTAELIQRTRPGVLFIDEAYSLTPTHHSDFGAEAIAALVKAMEDYRRDLAVIMAGYGDEMADLVASNPGLRSRFKTYVSFPDYEAAELTRIFATFAKDASIGLADGVLAKAEAIFEAALGTKDFGNARFARSLFEEAYARMSARAAADGVVTVDELRELAAEDVEPPGATPQRDAHRIGFTAADDPEAEP
jgi:Holliday junction resolvasome RuvABC ATP-dependent DNA helicase subunit